jgi:hypothetical protein
MPLTSLDAEELFPYRADFIEDLATPQLLQEAASLQVLALRGRDYSYSDRYVKLESTERLISLKPAPQHRFQSLFRPLMFHLPPRHISEKL